MSTESIVKQWRQTAVDPYISPNLARSHHARKYAEFLKKKARDHESTNEQVKQRMLESTNEEDRELVEHHVDLYIEEQYRKVILPLMYQAMQVEQTAEELLMSSTQT